MFLVKNPLNPSRSPQPQRTTKQKAYRHWGLFVGLGSLLKSGFEDRPRTGVWGFSGDVVRARCFDSGGNTARFREAGSRTTRANSFRVRDPGTMRNRRRTRRQDETVLAL